MKLNIKNRMKLVTGQGMWHTAKIKGIDQIMLCDGPHGLRKQDDSASSNNDSYIATCFPTASAVACSFDPDLVSLMASSIAKEAYNENVSILLGPGINMKRSPLCGRNFEYYSEDPYLASIYGAAFVKAVQHEGVGTSLKHFAGNSQEKLRMSANSMIDDKALREIYLRAFEYVCKESNPSTIMCSYNRLNGEFASANKTLLTDILRKEWGYNGLVVSDWGACNDLVSALKAGMDLEMPDSVGIHLKRLKKAYRKKKISEEEINVPVSRVLNLIEKYKVNPNREKKDISLSHQNAIDVCLGSAVLLKNNGILPLKTKDIVVVGELAEHTRFQGGGSSHINTNNVKSALEVFDLKGYKYTYYKGYSSLKDEIDIEEENKVINAISPSSTILFFGGLPDFAEGEGYDRKTLDMPQNQKSLLDRILKINKNVIFLSFSGSPYNMYFKNDVSAILHMYLGGEGVQEALEKLISGEVNPSGRLAETFPLKVEDTPCYNNYSLQSNDIKYKESIFIGYRYYDTFNVETLFPFGYGLSYSKFEYSSLSLSSSSFDRGKLSVKFKIKNISDIQGKVSSLVFIEREEGNYIQEKQSLKGFIKCELNPGEEKEVSLSLNEDSFSLYDDKLKRWVIPKGTYRIKICGHINEVFLETSINVEGEAYSRNEINELPSYFDKTNKLKNISDEEFKNLYKKEFSTFDNIKKGEYDVTTSLSELSKHSFLAKILLSIGIKEAKKICPSHDENDPEYLMMVEAIKEGTFDLVCCQAGGMIKPRLEDAIILSANGHKIKSLLKLIFG